MSTNMSPCPCTWKRKLVALKLVLIELSSDDGALCAPNVLLIQVSKLLIFFSFYRGHGLLHSVKMALSKKAANDPLQFFTMKFFITIRLAIK